MIRGRKNFTDRSFIDDRLFDLRKGGGGTVPRKTAVLLIIILLCSKNNLPAGNEISKVEGLEGLQQLRELVLDRNKIKVTFLAVLIFLFTFIHFLSVRSFVRSFVRLLIHSLCIYF